MWGSWLLSACFVTYVKGIKGDLLLQYSNLGMTNLFLKLFFGLLMVLYGDAKVSYLDFIDSLGVI